jgi:hypothetical protein
MPGSGALTAEFEDYGTGIDLVTGQMVSGTVKNVEIKEGFR